MNLVKPYTKTKLENTCINKNSGKNYSEKYPLYFKWKFGTINIRTGKEQSDGARLYMVAKQVADADLHICSLQEVRFRNSGKKIINLDSGETYVFFWSGPKQRRDAGVGILIKQCKDITHEDPDILDPRIIAMNITIKGYSIRLVNAYAPTNCDGSDSTKDAFYRMLGKASKKQQKNQKLVINGDFNATTSISTKLCYYDGRSIVEDSLCNDNGLRLKQYCQEKALCISQSYFDHPSEQRYTWYSGDGKTRKVIDYALVEVYTQQFMEQCEVYNNDFESDHRLLVATMKTPTTKKARRLRAKFKLPKRNPNPDPKDLENIEVKSNMSMQ